MLQDLLPDRRRKSALAIAFAAIAIILFSFGCYHSFTEIRQERHARAEQEARRALSSFEADANRLFDYADSYLRSVRAFYLRNGTGDPLNHFIEEVKAPHSESFSGIISILDREGRIVFRSDKPQSNLAEVPNMAATDHFQYWADHKDDELFIGSTRRGKVSGTLDFRIARKVERNGKFDGEIVLTLLPNQFLRFYDDLRLGPHSSTSLWTLEPRLIARKSQLNTEEELYEKLFPSITQYIERGQGTERMRSSVDGVYRFLAYKRLADYPLFIGVGLSYDDVDASLTGGRNNLALLAFGFFLFAALVCGLVLRQLHQNHDLRVARIRLEQSNADLEQFAYLASHDLQTPLRNVTSFVQLLERRYKGRLDKDGEEFMGFIVGAAKRMHELINDLLSYAQISNQNQQLRTIPTKEALDEALGNLKPDMDALKAKVFVDDLPAVMADKTQLVSLFQNLIGNALKYRHPERAPKVSIRAARHSHDQWRIAVEDNGIGIEKEYYGKIFQIFQRLSADPVSDGTGIGLAICKRIIERLGGNIWVESIPDRGTTFFFTLQDGAASTLADLSA